MSKEADTPLSVKVEGDQLVSRIGVERLAFCAQEASETYDEDAREYRKPLKVTDDRGFADDVIRALLEEEEDGSTPLGLLFDQVSIRAWEDGSIHCAEDVLRPLSEHPEEERGE